MKLDDSNIRTITAVEFCAGYCGIGLGVKQVIPTLRTIAYVEREAFAVANILAKIQNGLLDPAPIYSDLRTFPYRKFHGCVDIAMAGIPCQPHSIAGKRAGGTDERFLFNDFLDGCELMRPNAILIENVEGLLTSKMPDGTLCVAYTIERLEKMDYRVEAGVFSAAEIGAPHRRKRVFILALASTKDESIRGLRIETGEKITIAMQSSRNHRFPSRHGQPQFDWEPPRVC